MLRLTKVGPNNLLKKGGPKARLGNGSHPTLTRVGVLGRPKFWVGYFGI